MSRKSLIEKEKKRGTLIKKYKSRRENLKQEITNTREINQKLHLYGKLQKLPRNSSKVRSKNRCWVTGRSKSYYRFFGGA